MENQLQFEKSPYLLQHKSNPIHWLPWGCKAFGAARSEDKPIFLSIGYSTCHWCHVMAHESFEDPEAADAINGSFIPIKVDREERPDVDAVYMAACIAIRRYFFSTQPSLNRLSARVKCRFWPSAPVAKQSLQASTQEACSAICPTELCACALTPSITLIPPSPLAIRSC